MTQTSESLSITFKDSVIHSRARTRGADGQVLPSKQTTIRSHYAHAPQYLDQRL